RPAGVSGRKAQANRSRPWTAVLRGNGDGAGAGSVMASTVSFAAHGGAHVPGLAGGRAPSPTLATGPRSRGVPGQALRRRRQGPRALARVPGGRAGRVADPPRRPRPAVPCGAAAGPWLRPLGEPVRAGPAEPPPGLRTLPGP